MSVGPIYKLNGFHEKTYVEWICFELKDYSWALVEASNPGTTYERLMADFHYLKARFEVEYGEELISATRFGQAMLVLQFTPKGATWFKLLHVGEIVP